MMLKVEERARRTGRMFAATLEAMKEVNVAAVDWNEAPRNARWWAMDASGYAHWICVPDVAARTDFWFSESKLAPTFGFSGNWRESLTERPQKPAKGYELVPIEPTENMLLACWSSRKKTRDGSKANSNAWQAMIRAWKRESK